MNRIKNKAKQESASGGGGLFRNLFCQHDWIKREAWHQPPRSEGKVAWKCSRCGKAIQRKTWQAPV